MRSLRAKLALGFGGLLAILLAVSLLSIVVLTRYSHTLERAFRDNYNSAIYCDRMKEALDALDDRAQRRIWNDAQSGIRPDEAAAFRQFETSLNLQLANCTVPGEMELTRQLQTQWTAYKTDYQQFDSGRDNAAGIYRGHLLPKYWAAKQVAQQVADLNMASMVSVDGQVKRTLLGICRTLLFLLAMGVFVGATLVGTVGATVLRPLRT